MAIYYGMVWAYSSSDIIKHHGIKGQKWGVRRWQNDDGTLTMAGKEHYRVDGYDKKTGKEFRKELKGLKKLENKADISKQVEIKNKQSNKAVRSIATSLGLAGASLGTAIGTVASVKTNGLPSKIMTYDARTGKISSHINNPQSLALAGLSTITRFAAIGAFGKGLYHIGKKIAATRRLTEKGHNKAVRKLEQQRTYMVNRFMNTPYSEFLKQYKKE